MRKFFSISMKSLILKALPVVLIVYSIFVIIYVSRNFHQSKANVFRLIQHVDKTEKSGKSVAYDSESNFIETDASTENSSSGNSSGRLLIHPHGSSYCKILSVYCYQNRSVTSDTVTFITHGSLSFLPFLFLTAKRWDGPIIAVIFLPKPVQTNLRTMLDQLEHFAECSQKNVSASRIEFHAVYQSSKGRCPSVSSIFRRKNSLHEVSQLQRNRICGTIRIQVLAGKLDCNNDNFVPVNENKTELELQYPINAMRKIGKETCKTDLQLVSDIELIPTPNMASRFFQFYGNFRRFHPKLEKKVFVMPTFEVHPSVGYPETAKELINLMEMDKAFFYHAKYAGSCHRIPYPESWLVRSANLTRDTIAHHFTTKYLGACWEPVFIANASAPGYDERFVGYSLDKTSQVYELCRADYEFIILSNAFLIHSGIKEKKYSRTKSQDVSSRRNKAIFLKFKADLDQKYGVESRDLCCFPMV